MCQALELSTLAWPRTHNKTLQVYREQHWAPYILMSPLDGIPTKRSKYLWSPNPKRIKCRMTKRKKKSLSSPRPIFSQLNQLLSDLELSTIGYMFKYTQQQTTSLAENNWALLRQNAHGQTRNVSHTSADNRSLSGLFRTKS